MTLTKKKKTDTYAPIGIGLYLRAQSVDAQRIYPHQEKPLTPYTVLDSGQFRRSFEANRQAIAEAHESGELSDIVNKKDTEKLKRLWYGHLLKKHRSH